MKTHSKAIAVFEKLSKSKRALRIRLNLQKSYKSFTIFISFLIFISICYPLRTNYRRGLRLDCLFKPCDKKAVSSGYCDRHYRWTKKGWLDPSTNQVTDLCKGKIFHFAECKIKGCIEDQDLRKGFCNKHYRQYQRGALDLEGNRLRPLRKNRYGAHETCKVVGCEVKPRKWGFCATHAQAFAAGHITDKGIPNPHYMRKTRQYKRDWSCTLCGRVGSPSYILGFCKTPCYSRFRNGVVDFYGTPLRKMRVFKYPEGKACKVQGCDLRIVSRGMCRKHAEALRRGTLNEKGERLTETKITNQGKTCLVCDQPAKTRGYCRLHYDRMRESGTPYTDRKENPNWKNVGKVCSVDACNMKARALGMCVKHYARFLKREKIFKKSDA